MVYVTNFCEVYISKNLTCHTWTIIIPVSGMRFLVSAASWLPKCWNHLQSLCNFQNSSSDVVLLSTSFGSKLFQSVLIWQKLIFSNICSSTPSIWFLKCGLFIRYYRILIRISYVILSLLYRQIHPGLATHCSVF